MGDGMVSARSHNTVDVLATLVDRGSACGPTKVYLEDGVPDLLLVLPTVINKDLDLGTLSVLSCPDPMVAVICVSKNPFYCRCGTSDSSTRGAGRVLLDAEQSAWPGLPGCRL